MLSQARYRLRTLTAERKRELAPSHTRLTDLVAAAGRPAPGAAEAEIRSVEDQHSGRPSIPAPAARSTIAGMIDGLREGLSNAKIGTTVCAVCDALHCMADTRQFPITGVPAKLLKRMQKVLVPPPHSNIPAALLAFYDVTGAFDGQQREVMTRNFAGLLLSRESFRMRTIRGGSIPVPSPSPCVTAATRHWSVLSTKTSAILPSWQLPTVYGLEMRLMS